jgi:hypothetical protein
MSQSLFLNNRVVKREIDEESIETPQSKRRAVCIAAAPVQVASVPDDALSVQVASAPTQIDYDSDVEVVVPVKKCIECNQTDDDGELSVVGVSNEMKLPHLREHCVEVAFDKSFSSVVRPGMQAYLDSGILAHLFPGLKTSKNNVGCADCFCWVCDVPWKECPSWSLHCNASNKDPVWAAERESKVYLKASSTSSSRPPAIRSGPPATQPPAPSLPPFRATHQPFLTGLQPLPTGLQPLPVSLAHFPAALQHFPAAFQPFPQFQPLPASLAHFPAALRPFPPLEPFSGPPTSTHMGHTGPIMPNAGIYGGNQFLPVPLHIAPSQMPFWCNQTTAQPLTTSSASRGLFEIPRISPPVRTEPRTHLTAPAAASTMPADLPCVNYFENGNFWYISNKRNTPFKKFVEADCELRRMHGNKIKGPRFNCDCSLCMSLSKWFAQPVEDDIVLSIEAEPDVILHLKTTCDLTDAVMFTSFQDGRLAHVERTASYRKTLRQRVRNTNNDVVL